MSASRASARMPPRAIAAVKNPVLSYGPSMEVFLIPVGADRYELYCEVPEEDPVSDPEAPRGVFKRLLFRFREALAEAERERRRGHQLSQDETHALTWYQRVKRATMRRVAESIAEQ